MIALTDDQRVALIEEAIAGPFDARTKIAFVQMVLDAGEITPAHASGVPEEPITRKPITRKPITTGRKPPSSSKKAGAKRPHSGQGNTVQPLLALLEKNGRMTTTELAEASGIEPNRVTGSLAYQLKTGRVVRPAPSTYELA